MTGKWLAILALTAVVGGGAGAVGARVMAQREIAAPVAVAPTAPVAVAGTGGAAAGLGGAPAAKPGGRNNTTTGTVDRIEGEKLVVRTPTGAVEVPLTAQTTLMRQTLVAPADLKVGDAVFGRTEDVGGKPVVRQLQIAPPGGRGAGFGAFAFGGAGAATTDDGATARGGGGRNGPGGQGGANAPGAPGGGNGPGGAGQGIAGTLAKLDGKMITVTRPNGGEQSATLADDATIHRVAPAVRDDLKSGQSVVVASAPGNDGQARSVVTITSA